MSKDWISNEAVNNFDKGYHIIRQIHWRVDAEKKKMGRFCQKFSAKYSVYLIHIFFLLDFSQVASDIS